MRCVSLSKSFGTDFVFVFVHLFFALCARTQITFKEAQTLAECTIRQRSFTDSQHKFIFQLRIFFYLKIHFHIHRKSQKQSFECDTHKICLENVL